MRRLFWSIVWFFRTRRLAYCQGFTCQHLVPGCGIWTLCRQQVFAYSTSSVWMCEECADEEQIEVDAAWRDYYSSVL
jgi:hypothetical protein